MCSIKDWVEVTTTIILATELGLVERVPVTETYLWSNLPNGVHTVHQHQVQFISPYVCGRWVRPKCTL